MPDSGIAFLYERSRQSPIAILLILLKFGKTLLRQAWPLVVVFFISPQENWWVYAIYFAIIASFISAIISILAYYRFYFYVEEEELIIEKGIFQKTKLNIPFDRIQTVNFLQNPVHQLFNVVSLEVDTAGSNAKEFMITALEREKAEAIRSYLIAQKKETNPAESTEDDSDGYRNQESVTYQAEEKLLFNLSINDLLKLGVGQNHLRSVGLIIAALFGLYQIVGDALGEKKTNKVLGEYLGFEWQEIVTTLLMILPVVLFIAFFITLIQTSIRYFNLRLYRTENGFKTIAGLFNRQEKSATLEKIQWVRWSTNPLMKLFKQYKLQMAAASSTVAAQQQSLFIPGCYDAHIETVQEAHFPAWSQLKKTTYGISPLVIRRRFLFLGILPLSIFLFLSYFNGNPIAWLSLLWLPLIYWLSVRYHRKWKFHISAEGLRTDKGVFGEQATLLQYYKIQSVQIRQTPYQRRKGLANIDFFTAAGRAGIPYIDLEIAQQLKDYVLYKIETDDRKWM